MRGLDGMSCRRDDKGVNTCSCATRSAPCTPSSHNGGSYSPDYRSHLESKRNLLMVKCAMNFVFTLYLVSNSHVSLLQKVVPKDILSSVPVIDRFIRV